jgi:uncharacterized RDD family membrane protein YckC
MPLDLGQAQPPGLARRLAAILYDLVLLAGVLILAAALIIIPWVELTQSDFPQGAWWFRLYLVAVIAAYFGYAWVRGGQTLGMSAWRLKLLREDGGLLRPADALRRLLWATLALAPAGAGLLWVLLDRDGLAWHDRLSHTRLVVIKRT